MMLATFVGGRIRSPRRAFALTGLFNILALLMAVTNMKETIREKTPTPLSLKAANPLSFISFYRRSRALTALAILGLLREMGMYMDVTTVYQRRKFKAWGTKQDSMMILGMQVGFFLNTFATAPVMEYCGLQGAHRLHEWSMALLHLVGAYAPRMGFVYWSQTLRMLQAGEATRNRVLQQEAELLNLGQGELQGAESNRVFLPALVLPQVFSRIYMACSERFPAAPYLLASACHILAAEVGTPWAFKQLSPPVQETIAPRRTTPGDET